MIPVLSKHFRVIAFDHRGFGCSKDMNGLGPKALISDLAALLSHLRVDNAGHLLFFEAAPAYNSLLLEFLQPWKRG